MARQFWPNENQIGKRLALIFSSDKMREVAGLVGNVTDEGLDSSAPESMLYYPISQLSWPVERFGKFHSFPLQMAVCTAANPVDATAGIRSAKLLVHRSKS